MKKIVGQEFRSHNKENKIPYINKYNKKVLLYQKKVIRRSRYGSTFSLLLRTISKEQFRFPAGGKIGM